jgi:hypothetical protein
MKYLLGKTSARIGGVPLEDISGKQGGIPQIVGMALSEDRPQTTVQVRVAGSSSTVDGVPDKGCIRGNRKFPQGSGAQVAFHLLGNSLSPQKCGVGNLGTSPYVSSPDPLWRIDSSCSGWRAPGTGISVQSRWEQILVEFVRASHPGEFSIFQGIGNLDGKREKGFHC